MSDKKEDKILDLNGEHMIKDNKVYITGVIDSGFYLDVIVPFQRIMKEESKKKKGKIYIYLDSPGGDLNSAFALSSLIDQAKNLGITIITVVLGEAHSAASLISVQGDERYVSKYAMIIPHYPRGMDYSENPAQAENNKKRWDWINSTLVSIYKKHTKMKDIEKRLEQNNFTLMGGDDIIKQGFADHLVEESKIF